MFADYLRKAHTIIMIRNKKKYEVLKNIQLIVINMNIINYVINHAR